MKYRVIGRVAHIHTDAVVGLDDNQFSRRSHQLKSLGKNRYLVTGPRVSFKYGEFIDIDGGLTGRSAVLEAVGNKQAPPGISDEMLAEADDLKIRYGYGIGAKSLGERIARAKATKARIEAAAAEDDAREKADALTARRKAAKARA